MATQRTGSLVVDEQPEETDPHPTVILDEEFANLSPPLSATERDGLEQRLRAEGCLHPLIVWEGSDILVDGYNRYRICTKYGIPYRVTALHFDSRADARVWIIAHQGSKRNITAQGQSYLRGRRYLAEKQQHGGERSAREASGRNCHLRTDERLAAEYKVSPKTIRTDAEYAVHVDRLAVHCGEAVKRLVLSRDARLTARDVEIISRMEPEEQQSIFERIRATGTIEKYWLGGPEKRRVLVPVVPEELAQTLVRRLGRKEAIEACKEMAKVLGLEEPKETEEA